jgi:glutamate formiminotransferase/formiminotetrahydrofolate cyclodeaminase
MNVRINASGLKDKEFVSKVIEEGAQIELKALELENEIVKIVDGKIG